MTSARRWLLAAITGGLLTASYPPFAQTWLAWVALAPLLLAVDGARWRNAAGLGWLAGTIGGLGITGYWIWRAAADYFGLTPLLAAAFTFAVIQGFVAPFYALFGALAARLTRSRWRLVALPAALVACELARTALVGNAWALLGHSQLSLPLLQIVDLTGVAGLSFLLALVLGYGAWRLDHLPAAATSVRVALVQGAISNEQRRQPGEAAASVQHYVALTEAGAGDAALVLWPENAIAVFPEANAALLEPLRAALARRGGAVLSGAPRAGDRPQHAALYNSAYLFRADDLRPVYDKRHLLPFVEQRPLRPDDSPYLSGGEATPVPIGAVRAGILICYEIIDAALARQAVAAGANLLVNLSNDSWFAAGAGPDQHYAIARFRAVENRVALLRATNSGVSGAFDASGRELARLPADVATAAVVEAPLISGGSFYTRHGEWFAALCAAIVLVAIVRP